MPKRIIDLVREKEAQIQNNEVSAEDFAMSASAALNKGRESLEWRNFMSQFVDKDQNGTLNTAQLERLLATDETLGDVDLDRKRAYVMSNRMCGGGSPGATGQGVPALPLDFQVDSIDRGLALDCLAPAPPAPAPEPGRSGAGE